MAPQISLPLREWGGRRKGAGRKKAARPMVSRRARPTITHDNAVHVTLRVLPEIKSLRVLNGWVRRALFAGASKPGFRLVHFSIQGNHLHLIVEADSTQQLSRGMQGLTIRTSRAVNAAMSRRFGKVFADRFHAHVLRTPTETRLALIYVFENHRRHMAQAGRALPRGFIDPHSSAAAFLELENNSLPAPVSWLLRSGYLRAGPIRIGEA